MDQLLASGFRSIADTGTSSGAESSEFAAVTATS